MNCEVIDNFKIKTQDGIKEFTKGQVIPIHSKKATMLIEKGKVRPIQPHINQYGELTIPFSSPGKYHYWNGGQRLLDTLLELQANDKVIRHYVWGMN